MTSSYLQTLFTSIITKDVAQRHKVRKVTELFNLANYLLSNFCNPFTTLSLAEDLGMSSENTVKKFCGYLHEPYLFYYLPRYNNKLKAMMKAPKKVYVVDIPTTAVVRQVVGIVVSWEVDVLRSIYT